VRSAPPPQEEGPDVVLIGGAAAAVAAVGYFFWQKKNAGGSGAGAGADAPPVEGGMTLGEMGLSSAQMGGDAVPMGDNVPVGNASFAGMPTFTSEEDGAPAAPAAPRQIKGEFKRALREMMSEMRRFDTVDLHGRNLGDEGAQYISEALAFNDVATCIDFGANGIGAAGVAALCEALESNNALEMLSLASNNLCDEGAAVLAEYLKKDTTINTLNLNSSGIGDEGAAALAEMLKVNTTLTALELNNNSIDYEGTVALAEALAENSTLETFSISGNYVGGLGCKALANGLEKNAGIKGLQLNGNDIGDLGVAALCGALSKRETKLTNLDIGNNGFGFESGSHIAEYIATDESLTHLNLYMNELCDLGAIEIAKALKDNGGIETLDIGGNNILAAGAEALAVRAQGKQAHARVGAGVQPRGAQGVPGAGGGGQVPQQAHDVTNGLVQGHEGWRVVPRGCHQVQREPHHARLKRERAGGRGVRGFGAEPEHR
jgi:Ran GTPase-activating protein (RanGAP) involved in mRNA processing and transport